MAQRALVALLALAAGGCGSRPEHARAAQEPAAAEALAAAPAPEPAAPEPEPEPEPAPEPEPEPGPPPIRAAGPLRITDTSDAPSTTACRALAYIGDSTATGTASEKYIRDPDRRIDARLKAIGVAELALELFGGRSLIEHRAQNENGLMVATRLREAGFRGCWLIALGTNDAANVAKDPTITPPERIARMMEIVGDEPILWIDAITRADREGYWSRANMEVWNQHLAESLAAHPNARIYAWSAEMRDEWYVRDGIHYTSAGYAARAERVARALAIAFPGG